MKKITSQPLPPTKLLGDMTLLPHEVYAYDACCRPLAGSVTIFGVFVQVFMKMLAL